MILNLSVEDSVFKNCKTWSSSLCCWGRPKVEYGSGIESARIFKKKGSFERRASGSRIPADLYNARRRMISSSDEVRSSRARAWYLGPWWWCWFFRFSRASKECCTGIIWCSSSGSHRLRSRRVLNL